MASAGGAACEGAGAPILLVHVEQTKRATLRFGRNPLNSRRNGLPKGVRGVQLWCCDGDEPAPDERDWHLLGEYSRSPHVYVLMNAQPQTLTFRAVYIDRHNRTGAFSTPATATVNP